MRKEDTQVIQWFILTFINREGPNNVLSVAEKEINSVVLIFLPHTSVKLDHLCVQITFLKGEVNHVVRTLFSISSGS